MLVPGNVGWRDEVVFLSRCQSSATVAAAAEVAAAVVAAAVAVAPTAVAAAAVAAVAVNVRNKCQRFGALFVLLRPGSERKFQVLYKHEILSFQKWPLCPGRQIDPNTENCQLSEAFSRLPWEHLRYLTQFPRDPLWLNYTSHRVILM